MYYPWLLYLRDGTTITAKFTNKEIEEYKILYPEINWGHT